MGREFLSDIRFTIRNLKMCNRMIITRQTFMATLFLLSLVFQLPLSGNTMNNNQNAANESKTVFFISLTGNDNWSGTIEEANTDKTDGPFATLERAREAVKQMRKTKNVGGPVVVQLRGGTYYRDKIFVLKPEDSGTEISSTIYESYPNERAAISGGKIIQNWKKGKGLLWLTKLPEVQAGKFSFSQLYVNGNRRYRPRYPQEGLFKVANLPPLDKNSWMALSTPESGELPSRAFKFEKGNIQANWTNFKDAEVVISQFWTETRLKIQRIDDKENLVLLAGEAFRPLTWSFGYYVDNVFEEIQNEPGTWYLDKTKGVLFYHPLPGEDMSRAEVVAPKPNLKQLVQFEGDVAHSELIKYTAFQNLTFAHTAWELPPEGQSCAQAEITIQSAILADGTSNCGFKGCEFEHTGGWCIEMRKGCRNTTITRNRFTDIGAGVIKIGEPAECKSDAEETRETIISDNYIQDAGKGTLGAAAIWIGQSSNNIVSHNDISGSLMWAVSVGWIWGYFPLQRARNNIVEFNYIHELGIGALGTHGAIYALGTSPGTCIRNNYIRNVYSNEYWGAGEGIILDNGCFGIIVENNIVYNAVAGGYGSNFNCAGNFIHNNIFMYGTKFQLTVYGDQPDGEPQPKGEIFSRNIVVWKEGPLLKEGNWPNFSTLWDANVYFNETNEPVTFLSVKKYTIEQWKEKGLDKNSVVGDPLLIDPEHGDFSLKPESPALKLGFKPIDISTVGPGK